MEALTHLRWRWETTTKVQIQIITYLNVRTETHGFGREELFPEIPLKYVNVRHFLQLFYVIGSFKYHHFGAIFWFFLLFRVISINQEEHGTQFNVVPQLFTNQIWLCDDDTEGK